MILIPRLSAVCSSSPLILQAVFRFTIYCQTHGSKHNTGTCSYIIMAYENMYLRRRLFNENGPLWNFFSEYTILIDKRAELNTDKRPTIVLM